MNCGVDEVTDEIRISVNRDEVDVLVAALAFYELSLNHVIASAEGSGLTKETSLSCEIYSGYRALAVSMGKNLLPHGTTTLFRK